MGELRKGTRVRLSDERLDELDDRSATLYVGRVGEAVASSKAAGLLTVEFPQDDERRPTMLTDAYGIVQPVIICPKQCNSNVRASSGQIETTTGTAVVE